MYFSYYRNKIAKEPPRLFQFYLYDDRLLVGHKVDRPFDSLKAVINYLYDITHKENQVFLGEQFQNNVLRIEMDNQITKQKITVPLHKILPLLWEKDKEKTNCEKIQSEPSNCKKSSR